MTKRKPSYPQDEFDLAPDAIRRSGVHRGTKSWWSQVWPYLLALVLAVGVGYGTITWLMQSPDSKVTEYINEATGTESATTDDANASDDGTTDTSEEPAQTEEPADDQTSADAEPTDGAETDAPTGDPTTEEPAATIDRSVSIRVLNAGSVSGAAATAASKITSDGFTAVEAANFEGTKPASSIIYYRGAENKANAERIGEVLGISNLSEVTELRAAVSVVLR